jgi:pyruvate kinase
MTLQVREIKSSSVMAEVMNNAVFGNHKNMNLPGSHVDLPTLTEKDIDDLVNFGIRHQVDFIAASFVRCGADIDNIRDVLHRKESTTGQTGENIKIIAKIENQQGLENFDEILTKTDGIMVARGDLGMEIPIEKVFIAQKMMIYKSNIAGKPVVTATQMLESMILNPRPTRAECADVANAVLDGTDCVMLSGETANGDFPQDALKMMAATCVEAESMIDYDEQYDAIRHTMLTNGVPMSPSESVASSAVKTARDLNAKAIIVMTETGCTARLIAKYRPFIPILALTSHEDIARQMQGYLKNTRVEVFPSMEGNEKIILQAIDRAKNLGLCAAGDNVIVVHGHSEKATAGSTSVMRVFPVN